MSLVETYISALLPVRNGASYLDGLIPRIVDMLKVGDELLVINDGSTDSTADILSKWSSFDPRIKVITTRGSGLVSALNLGVSNAQNSWIARFDVDDLYHPQRLLQQRRLLAEDVAVVFTDYAFISSGGRRLGKVHTAIFPVATAISLISSQRTAHPSALINREMLIQVGGYRSDDFPAEDLAVWLRLSKVGTLLSVPETLLYYRLSRNTISANNRRIQILKKCEVINSFNSWIELYEISLKSIYETMCNYKESPCGEYRIALHLRDLVLVERLLKLPHKRINLITTIGPKMFLKVVFASILIALQALNRRCYRSGKRN